MIGIGKDAFSECNSLQKVIIKDIAAWCKINFENGYSNPLHYTHKLFNDNNTEIKRLVIPNNVTSIGNYAFISCNNLTSVTIGSSVTSIGNYAFQDCSNLTSVTIGNSVTSIGKSAFGYCKKLTSVVIPNSVSTIKNYAFIQCTKLSVVTLGKGVIYIA